MIIYNIFGIGKNNASNGAIINPKGTNNNETLSKTLTAVYNIISKGNQLKNQYGFIIPKLASMMAQGGKGI